MINFDSNVGDSNVVNRVLRLDCCDSSIVDPKAVSHVGRIGIPRWPHRRKMRVVSHVGRIGMALLKSGMALLS